jgi:hypothetical protein
MIARDFRDILLGNLLIAVIFLSVAYLFGTGLDQKESACLLGQIDLPAEQGSACTVKTYCRGLVDTAWAYSLMTIGIGLYTFFSLLNLPLAEKASIFGERVRFAITVTLVVVFVVFYGIVGYWTPEEVPSQYSRGLMDSLTQLLGIVIPFYFGAAAAVEIFERKNATGKPEEGEAKPPFRTSE